MKRKAINAISFILIICISLALGIAVNETWSYIELKTHPKQYADIVARYSLEYGVPERVIFATIKIVHRIYRCV